MGRLLRMKAPEVTYHITSRTNGKKLFMKKSKDRKALCRCLQRIKLKHQAKIYGFTPMGNHFHLLVKMVGESDLSAFMCEFKTAYAKYYNRKHNTSGHFWGDRFHSTIIAENKHMLACLRYIDRNPIKAQLVEQPGQWSYSTYACYAFGQSHLVLTVDLHPTYLALAENTKQRCQLYADYVRLEDSLSDSLPGELHTMRCLGSAEFVSSF
jgi:REP-associated tyrosine transposase